MDGIRITPYAYSKDGVGHTSYEVTTTGDNPMLLGSIYADDGVPDLLAAPFLGYGERRADMLGALAHLLQVAVAPRSDVVEHFRTWLADNPGEQPWRQLWANALAHADTLIPKEAEAA